MDRRSAILSLAGLSAGALALSTGDEAAAQAVSSAPNPASASRDKARRGLPPLKITDIKVIHTQVGGNHLINCKVFTSEPGLYGIGCGTHSERPLIVASTIDNYLKPFLVGRNADEIEKIWQELWIAPYWRASVDANNAMAAVDAALWDIMGKRCGLPVYDLLGGKVRDGLRVLADVQARTPQDLDDQIHRMMDDGYRHFRVYLAGPQLAGGTGGAGLGTLPAGGRPPRGDGEGGPGVRRNDAEYINQLCTAFDHIRKTFGFDIEIGHDVHERPSAQGAVMLAKAVEPYRPFFVEDLFAPEQVDWYKIVRAQSSVGIAMGELFVNQNEWLPLVSNRLIDYFRMHISAGGGLNLARKAAHVCEFFDVRTAWHGPANVSPVGHAVNLHIDLSIYNFGICEGRPFTDQLQELFPGCPEIRKGVRYANDLPGLGIDIDEKVAAKYAPKSAGSNRGGFDTEGAPRRP